ncbi:hypothetical protein [Halorubellus sp. PRR65]|uniref:VirB4 family type IV secretion system protein n=1 Tax=Halorubellus sp. PRR65 TaxID=3098148 RepID=UPI002B257CDB|nr:hypothetical protein [Halorubellus sp. PRR65]
MTDTYATATLDGTDEPDIIPFLGIPTSDLWLLIGIPGLVLFSGLALDQRVFGILFGAVAFAGVGAVVYATPSFLTTRDWLNVLRAHYTTASTHENRVVRDIDLGDPGSFFERFQTDQSTRELTHIDHVYPGRGVVERDDGQLVAALELDPPNQDFAGSREWEHVAAQAAEFANNALDFDLQVYLTTQQFDIEDYTNTLAERLEDDEVRDHAILNAVVQDTIESRPRELEDAGTSPVHAYLIVSVDRTDVIMDSGSTESSGFAKLGDIPLLGIPFQIASSMREGLSDAREHALMLSRLDSRLTTIRTEYVNEIEGADARQLTTGEWLALAETYWQGSERHDHPEKLARRSPAITASPGQATARVDSYSAEDASEQRPSVDGDLSLGTPNSEAAGEESEADTPPETSQNGDMFEVDEDDWQDFDEAASGDATDDTEASAAESESGLTPVATGSRWAFLPWVESTERSDEEKLAIVDDDLDRDLPPNPTASSVSAPDADPTISSEIPATEALQGREIAPEGIEREYDHAVVGEQYRRAMFAHGWPDEIEPGALRHLIGATPHLEFDMTLHFTPRDRGRVQKQLERRAQGMSAESNANDDLVDGFFAHDQRERVERTAAMRDHVRDGERPFDVSLYVSARADDKDTLDDDTEALRKALQDKHSYLGMKTVTGKQLRTLESIAPIGKDYLRREPELDPSQLALGGGVGALLGSLTRSELLEDDGVEMGEHAFNGTPLIKDPFESETNYNWVVIGDSGSGKSYQTKLNALRTRAVKENTKVIILDPMQGFNGIAKAMGAKRITLGGSRGLNPLEIRAPTEASRRAAGEDIDPLSEKIRDVMSFFDNFAHREGIDLGPERMTLTTAITEAYARNGITADVDTHSNPSPTLVDVLDVLEEMATEPEEFIVRIESEAEEIAANATDLINLFRPFIDGQYQNLAEPSEFDLRDEDVVYLDLSQQEKRQSGGGLMMQLVFSLVYERAKETTDNVVFIIDEARFLMRDAANLEFLGQRVRHSRHYDTSIRFITQEVNDFFDHEEAEAIINNSFVKLLHRTQEIGQWADAFGLNRQQVGFVKNANTGANGYSEALAEIDGTWYPIQLFSTPAEHAVVDFDERQDSVEDLPGMGDETRSPLVERLRHTLRMKPYDAVDDPQRVPAPPGSSTHRQFHALSDRQQEYLSLLSDTEILSVLEAIDAGRDPVVAIAGPVTEKLNRLFGGVDERDIRDVLRSVGRDEGSRSEQSSDAPVVEGDD